MRILIASKTLEITTAMREFAHEQALKLDKLGQRISKVQVFLDQRVAKSKRDRNALVKYVVNLPGKTIVIKTKAADMYDAIVDATDKVFRQTRKFKEKRLTKQR
ncbi:MAG: ribosome-associated translation inhibitor RaiA [Candidatus Pacebacteria bacterium]|jgi:ribosomal subunit interface protein|nr:ribosome-associated translation inhibitor RaiA [Candidatus Paceibacterota bacterium]MBT3512010.1 ribosome-associated translation inhibitor RaiA [Candidatus Paceibacterota bacterium]MBT4004862.1 ribosome-associated translation inhibitor RaiA [Candidatus Paceibacterota bacterium]MBT4359041.1 ribosome-associated translation inhibitor RaiA [Candidatus Paceibacterota bacterium]MBT4680528.1 ribosome-associated translation inhibitor RaiA [Candidatus Paceibacterota bacterium]